MKQCHRFLCSWQDTKLIPCTDCLKIKSLATTTGTCFKTAISWFRTNDIQYILITPYSNNEYVMYYNPGHVQIIEFWIRLA